MHPKVWGPNAWIFLHSITFNYPEKPTNNEKQEFKQFFESLVHILPCYTCRLHYKENLNKYPLTYEILSNKNELIKWLIDVHNSVNKTNGQKIYSYNEAIDYYTKLYENADKETLDNNKDINNLNKILVSTLIVIVFIYLIVKNSVG